MTAERHGRLLRLLSKQAMNDMKEKTLIVVDMQNDFIDGSLGTKEAAAMKMCRISVTGAE